MKKALLCFMLIIILFLLSGCMDDYWKEKYEQEYEKNTKLESRIDELQGRIDDLEENIGMLQEPSSTLWCYFEGEDDVTFDKAHEAFDEINDVLTNKFGL